MSLSSYYIDKAKTKAIPEMNALKELQSFTDASNYTGYLPSESLYQQQAQADSQLVLDQLPFQVEEFNSQLASRGIFSSGEATKFLYNQVYDPALSRIASINANSRLAFSTLNAQTRLNIDQLRLSGVQTYLNYILEQKRIEAEAKARQAGFWGSIFGSAIKIGGGLLLGGPVGGAAAATTVAQ